jgi:hypothetical protein
MMIDTTDSANKGVDAPAIHKEHMKEAADKFMA